MHTSLYQQAGLDQHFENLWREIDAEYRSLPKRQVAPAVDEKVQEHIRQQFDPAHLKSTILEFWQNQLSSADVSVISQWLGSATGRKLTLAEIDASLSNDDAQYSRYLADLKNSPPTKLRIDLLRRLDKSVRASAASTDLGIHINLAAVTAQHAAGLAPADANTPEQQAKSHESDRAFIRAMMRQSTLKYNLFTYRHLDDQALREYIGFAESPAGENYHRSTFFAVREAMNKATLELERLLLGQNQQASR
ncbi:MAG: hypothetical protein ACPGSC_11710 [Granulosicoccaceae bacterium]